MKRAPGQRGGPWCGGRSFDVAALYLSTDLGGKRIADMLGLERYTVLFMLRSYGLTQIKKKPGPVKRLLPIDAVGACAKPLSIQRVTVRAYVRARRLRDPSFRMAAVCRSSVSRIARKLGRSRRTLHRTSWYLGCTFAAARHHIEAQFKHGMTWENHGAAWEIDHIRPLASFDLTTEAQMKAACHFSNLQPLWKEENRRKSDTYIAA